MSTHHGGRERGLPPGLGVVPTQPFASLTCLPGRFGEVHAGRVVPRGCGRQVASTRIGQRRVTAVPHPDCSDPPGQQPCLLWLVGQGASTLGVPVGFGDGLGLHKRRCPSPGTLTTTISSTCIPTRDDRSISMTPC